MFTTTYWSSFQGQQFIAKKKRKEKEEAFFGGVHGKARHFLLPSFMFLFSGDFFKINFYVIIFVMMLI
ncbi:hypothetical protein E1A91_D07G099400v1 [Gossypium mustelinum]|uniref:Uncharacterized protein n=3 Tax=Gossypium TaxID=3633 RepID=A0A5J5QR15_GOSBA|nr:hypothetical protein ES319_D07G096300v1 [Gossypium barbadense]TYH62164.1 hypothetical protein ES332_D07G100900v1 [Gossypium tomentosum]TYI72994.1 hypothetical protein E1A91_D07G099400v1 [Gossypium mustelinum]